MTTKIRQIISGILILSIIVAVIFAITRQEQLGAGPRVLVVPQGGTGASSFTPETVIMSGATATDPLQGSTTPTFDSFHVSSTATTSVIAGSLTVLDTLSAFTLAITGVVLGDMNMDGYDLLNAKDITAGGSISGSHFIATGTSATSTFAGGLTVDGTDFVVDPDANRVGIGTSTPSAKLEVVSVGVNTIFDSGAVTDARLEFHTDNVREALLSWDENALSLYADSGGYLRFGANNTEAVRIDSSGNVGIGTTTPEYLLDVDGDFRVGEAGQDDAFFADATQGWLGVGKVPSARRLEIKGLTGGVNSQIALFDNNTLKSTISTNSGTGDLLLANTANMRFYTGSTIGNVATLPTNERMIIDSSGNVGIGTSTPNATLNVHSGDGGEMIASTNADDLVVENSTHGGISILVPDGGDSSLYFGSPSDTVGALMSYRLNNDLLKIGTAGAGGEVAFLSANQTEAMRIDSDGNVGIGTTTPMSLFAIESDSGSVVPRLTISSSDNAVADSQTIGSLTFRSNDASTYGDGIAAYVNAVDAGPGSNGQTTQLEFGTRISGLAQADAVTNMVLTGVGNLGIGTTTPAYLLSVEAATNNYFTTNLTGSSAIINLGRTGANRSATLNFDLSSVREWSIGTSDSDLAGDGTEFFIGTDNTSPAIWIETNGNVGIGSTSPRSTGNLVVEDNGEVRVIVSELGGNALTLYQQSVDSYIQTAGRLRLYGGNSELMTLGTNGNVGVGTTTAWRDFSVTGTVAFDGLTSSGTGNAVCITGDNDITDAGGGTCTPSSERFKTNILSLEKGYALNVIKQLRPVSFDYKDGYYNAEDGKEAIGLIAEEVAEVDTRMVDYEENGEVRTLYFERFVGLFTQAIQELRGYVGKIASLALSNRDRIDALEAENEALKARLTALENE